MGALLTVFSGPWAWAARLAIYAALVAAIFGFGWVKGDEHGTEKLTEYVGAQAKQSAAVVVKQGAVTEKVVDHYIQVAGKTKTVVQYVDREVTKYAESNPGNCLDAEWRRLHDAAATNTIPGPAGGSDAARGAPTAAQALSTTTGNYGACNRTADRLDALQAWVRGQGKVRP
jgi:hypothetical protein